MTTGAKSTLGGTETGGSVDIMAGGALHLAIIQPNAVKSGGVTEASPLAGKRDAVVDGNRMAPVRVNGDGICGLSSEADGLIAAYGSVVTTEADLGGGDCRARIVIVIRL